MPSSEKPQYYTKKPVLVHAVRVIHQGFICDPSFWPPWLRAGFNEIEIGYTLESVERGFRQKPTHLILRRGPDNQLRADVGDWIIREPNGELVVCKHPVFKMAYDPADE